MNGAALARDYHEQVVLPLLQARWPGLPHAAGRLGSGSDVLGLDDDVSRDHDWGLRLTLLVEDGWVDAVDEYLQQALPAAHRGRPTRFPTTWCPRPRHQVEVATAAGFAASRLGVPVDRPWDVQDWLAVTGQSVLEVTAGPVFADTSGAITQIRRRLTWYPHDVWRYVVATDWQRIGQALPFVARTGSRGDDLGSRLLTASLAQTAVHLGFLLHRRWPPYTKWSGTMFVALPGAGPVARALDDAVRADDWPARQRALVAALEGLHELQRGAGLPTGDTAVEPFWERSGVTVHRSVTPLLLRDVADPALRRLPGVGSVEQWVDNVDVLASPRRRRAAAEALRPLDADGEA